MTHALRGDRNKLEVKRRLRANMTPAERALWDKLRAKQFMGLKFRRQHGIGRFVADFFCASQKLVIEVDGEIHEDPRQAFHDAERTKYFMELGLNVIRYSNEAILKDLEATLFQLASHLNPLLVKEGAGGGSS
ncbi:MAG TPA: endonuclease domain-containing protein [bacterium]|nr:endonuclease domain-containing protein [bacterium]